MTLSLIWVDPPASVPPKRPHSSDITRDAQPTNNLVLDKSVSKAWLFTISLSPDLKRTTFPPKWQLNYIIKRSVVTSMRRHPYFFFVFFFCFLSVFSATSVDYSSFADRCSSWIELIKLKAQTIRRGSIKTSRRMFLPLCDLRSISLISQWWRLALTTQ